MHMLLFTALLSLPLAAQEEAQTPLARVELAGPAAWHARLRPTNVGTLLASAEGEALWRPWAQQLHGILPGLLGADGAAVPEAWLAYAGTVEMVVYGQPGTDSEPLLSGRVTFGADGQRDVAALAAASLRLASDALGLQFAPAFEGSDLAVAQVDQWIVTMPKVSGPRASVYFGNDKAGVRKLLDAELPAAGRPPTPSAPLLLMSIDLQASERLRVASGGPEQPEMSALGFDTVRTFEVTVGAAGPHVQAELGVTFGEGDRGVYAGLFPARAGVPDLFWAIAPEARAWKVGRFDALAVWHAVVRAVALGRSSPEEVAAEAREETGVDIEKDLLAHLTDEVMVSWHPWREAGKEDDNLGLCMAMRVRDPAAFQVAFAKFLRSNENFEVREADGILRADEERVWFVPAFSFGAGKGLVAFALGDRAPSLVDAMLAQVGKEAAMPAEFEVLTKGAPAGFNSVGVVELGILIRHYLDGLIAVLDLPGDGARDDVAKAMEVDILPLLGKQHLDRVLTLTGGTPTAWRFRILW